ncbi:hypothetical protein H0H93_008252 [Arthromyces matolae]|nr:hypothetical protein H0H93_008252 [Arthromyces matolae]
MSAPWSPSPSMPEGLANNAAVASSSSASANAGRSDASTSSQVLVQPTPSKISSMVHDLPVASNSSGSGRPSNELRVWNEKNREYMEMETITAPKTLQIWDVFKERFVTSPEQVVLNALDTTFIDHEPESLLNSLDATKLTMIAFVTDKPSAEASYYDPRYGDTIFISQQLVMAFEQSSEGSPEETSLRWCLFASLTHEFAHLVIRKTEPSGRMSVEAWGLWKGEYIEDHGQKGESGYALEGHLFGGIARPLAKDGDRAWMVRQEKSTLPFNNVSGMALHGKDPRAVDFPILSSTFHKVHFVVQLLKIPVMEAEAMNDQINLGLRAFTNEDTLPLRREGHFYQSEEGKDETGEDEAKEGAYYNLRKGKKRKPASDSEEPSTSRGKKQKEKKG